MESFKKELKKRIITLTLYAIFFGAAIVFSFVLSKNTKSSEGLSAWNLTGFLFGIGAVVLYRIRVYTNALKKEEALETLHIKETDERNRTISMKTCRSCIFLGFAALGFAGITASFINQTVFYTIGVILIFFLLLYVALFLFYSKTN